MADQKKNEDMSEDELDQIIADMSKEEEEAAAPQSPTARVAPIALVREERGEESVVNNDQSLRMELSGVINLKLNFVSGGRSVELICTDETLICRMADGTEFRIPTGFAEKKKSA